MYPDGGSYPTMHMNGLQRKTEQMGARLQKLVRQYRNRPSPYTRLLILGVSLIFLLELAVVHFLDAPSVKVLMDYLFIHYPLSMWVLAPFLHRGVGHFAANVGILWLLLPAESYLSDRSYGGLFFGAGVFSTYFGGWYLLMYGSKPNVAFYGISGFVYGLAGFALLYTVFSNRSWKDADWITFSIGLSALIVVGIDLLTAIGSPLALNPGHLFGFAFGITVWTAVSVVGS